MKSQWNIDMPEWERELFEKATDRDLAEHIRTALSRLLKEDAYLLKVDVNERSISHILALYLKEEFPDWDVDCEYNRDGHDSKRLMLDSTESALLNDTQGSTVYPDIIVHKRGKAENLLAIEIKKTNGGSEIRDLSKLNAFGKELKYSCGLFLRFDTGPSRSGISKVQWSVE